VPPPTRQGTLSPALFKLGKKVLEPVRNALVYHVIINALENVPEPTLIFAAQAPSSLSCMGVGVHCRLWPLRFGAGGFRLNRRLRGRFEPN
jgi:hypothetical protein